MTKTSNMARWVGAPLLLAAVSLGSAFIGMKLGRQYEENVLCCGIPTRLGNVRLTVKEKLGLVKFYSQIGQDKWVSETVFPGVANGFFVDVGSGDGTHISNTKALEAKGWTGICIDPFPTNMQDRTCQMFKNAVYSETGKKVTFQAPGGFGVSTGDSFGQVVTGNPTANVPTVELITMTLGDILERAKAPRFIHFLSMDIEGAEVEALHGFPFDKYRVGAWAIEHNLEEPRRTLILKLMESHGYKRVHMWGQDDFYVPAQP